MIWDLRMLKCVQTFHDAVASTAASSGSESGLNSIEVCPARRQVVCAGKSLSVYRQVGWRWCCGGDQPVVSMQ